MHYGLKDQNSIFLYTYTDLSLQGKLGDLQRFYFFWSFGALHSSLLLHPQGDMMMSQYALLYCVNKGPDHLQVNTEW